MGRASKYKKRTTATTTNPLQRDEAHKRAYETALPVVQSLKSASEKERKWSTAIITELVQDDTVRLALLREGVVNALLDRLTDDNKEVIHDALGSIDALILKTGESLCKELYRKNILVLMDMILHQVPVDQPKATDMDSKRRQESKFTYSLLEIYYLMLTRICENCDEAAEATVKLKLYLRSIDLLLQLPQLPVPLKSSIAIFIRTMTTERPHAVQAAFDHLSKDFAGCIASISKVGTGFDWQSKRDETSIGLDLTLGDIIINAAEAYWSKGIAPPQPLHAITSFAKATFEAGINSRIPSDNSDPSSPTLAALKTISNIATYLNTYLEIYPETTPPEISDRSQDENFFQYEMEVDSQLPPINSALLTELLSAIPLILKQQLPVPVIPYALETINDIAWTMTLRIPEWQEWQIIAQQLVEFSVPRLEGMVALGEDTTSTFLGSVLAAAKSLSGKFALDADDIRLLENLYEHSTTPELQAKIVGILGIAAQTNSIETCQYITAFMMRNTDSQNAVVVVEILDELMEIFADGDKVYDRPIFVEGNMLSALRQGLPDLRKRIKSIDARKDPELRERADDVLANFIDFLKYKEEEAKQN